LKPTVGQLTEEQYSPEASMSQHSSRVHSWLMQGGGRALSVKPSEQSVRLHESRWPGLVEPPPEGGCAEDESQQILALHPLGQDGGGLLRRDGLGQFAFWHST